MRKLNISLNEIILKYNILEIYDIIISQALGANSTENPREKKNDKNERVKVAK